MRSRSTFPAVAAALSLVAVLLAGCGGNPLAADTGTAAAVTESGGRLFDSSVIHDIELTYDQADYEAMIETLAETGSKEWIDVTVIIDGMTYESAGARLKGNSSLAGLSGGGPGGGGLGRGGPEGAGSVSADEPEELPWLIRLDHTLSGQNHDGYVDIVIRSNNSETALNEAVALDLLEEAGLASQEAASVRFTVNGSESTLRLMIEHPSDDAWQDANFAAAGALYKAESTGDWSYRGDDQDAYVDVFDQEGGKNVTDLTPLIEFLQFVNESDDETFASELPERLDVESFATYLAMMELVDNFDDIDGPGNNAYLWWDADTEQFTIVPWDLNLAFGGLGGPGGGGGLGGPRGFSADGGQGPDRPDGFEPPEGFELPEGFEPPEGFDGQPTGGGFGAGAFGRSNPLVERFLAEPEFEALYQEKLDQLGQQLFESGVADDILARWVSVLTDQATDVVDAGTIEQEADAIAQSLAGR